MGGMATVSPGLRGTAKRIWENPPTPWCATFCLAHASPSARQGCVPMRTPVDDRAVGGAQHSDASTCEKHSPACAPGCPERRERRIPRP
eukprot:5711032-Pyramimonas_sp.AAC.1